MPPPPVRFGGAPLFARWIHERAARSGVVPGRAFLRQIAHRLALPPGLLRKLGRAAPGAGDVGHHEVRPPEHPLVAPGDGKAGRNRLQSPRKMVSEKSRTASSLGPGSRSSTTA